MKDQFNLKFKKAEKANVRYRDPEYNEKRLWIGRLVAQFIKEDVILISIDESNFRHDALPGKQWQFDMTKLGYLSNKVGKKRLRPG